MAVGAACPLPVTADRSRIRLRHWKDDDLDPFAAINADPEVMRYFPASLSRGESDALAQRIRAGFTARGWGFWALERRADERFIGFVGLSPVASNLPFAPAVEIGWRLARDAWHQGFATEAALASLRFAFEALSLDEVVSFTARTNGRSLAVMRRLRMREQVEGFEHPALPVGHPLRRHRLFRISHPGARTDAPFVERRA